MYSISIFYFTLYLFGGAYEPNASSLPTGLTRAQRDPTFVSNKAPIFVNPALECREI